MLKLTYISHSAFILEDGEYKVIIDPYITGNPTATIKWQDVSANYIALTHAHGDHFGDTLQIAKANKSTVIAVNELANYVARKGVNAHNMHIGGSHNFPFGKLKFTIAHHGSSTDDGEYMGEPAGIVITIGGKTIYHAGDTGIFMDMKLIAELDKIDVFLVPIGGNFTMDSSDAAKATQFVSPKLVIPMHYNTFPAINTDPNQFKQLVEKDGFNCRVMNYGETIEL